MSRKQEDLVRRLSNVYTFEGCATGWAFAYDLMQTLPVELGRERSGNHEVIAVKTVEFWVGMVEEATWRMGGSWMAMLHTRPNGDMVTHQQMFEDDVIYAGMKVTGPEALASVGENYMVFEFPEPGFIVTQRQMYFSFTTDGFRTEDHYIGYNMFYVHRTISASQYARIACAQKPLD